MPRLTKDQWAQARIRWEADPTLSFEDMAQTLGVSKQAVGKRAKDEGWEREPDLKSVGERAQFKADQREANRKVDGLIDGEIDGKTSKRLSATRELAEDIRADVIERHRADWAEHRIHFKTSEIAENFEIGKSAKISSEMLAIRQKGERAAYGLDDTSATETIEIVRSYGGKG